MPWKENEKWSHRKSKKTRSLPSNDSNLDLETLLMAIEDMAEAMTLSISKGGRRFSRKNYSIKSYLNP